MLNDIGKALPLMSGHIKDRFDPTETFLLTHNPTEGLYATRESMREQPTYTRLPRCK